MKTILMLLLAGVASGQVLRLTLSQAREMAVKNHPQLQALNFASQATLEVSRQIRSVLQPQVSAGITGNAAMENSRIAFASPTSSVLFSRVGAGVQVNQLVSDFGRVRKLGESNDTRASAERQGLENYRLVVLARVDRAWFNLLRARSVKGVAEETLKARQLLAEQVGALADAKLRSTLDVSFARVNLADAKLLLVRANNEVATAETDLAAALGMPTLPSFETVLTAEQGDPVPDSLEAFVQQALGQRPDLKQSDLEVRATQQLLDAEQRLKRPTVTVSGLYGVIPNSLSGISNQYGVLSVNLLYPIFNGRQFEARQQEVALRLKAIEKRREDLRNQASQEVRSAYFAARTAGERIAASKELLDQAALSLELAQARYDLGLGTIVELSQAQLTKTGAEVGYLSAQYEDRLARLVLRYLAGEMGQ